MSLNRQAGGQKYHNKRFSTEIWNIICSLWHLTVFLELNLVNKRIWTFQSLFWKGVSNAMAQIIFQISLKQIFWRQEQLLVEQASGHFPPSQWCLLSHKRWSSFQLLFSLSPFILIPKILFWGRFCAFKIYCHWRVCTFLGRRLSTSRRPNL